MVNDLQYEIIEENNSVSEDSMLFLSAEAALILSTQALQTINKDKIEAIQNWLLDTCETAIRNACANGDTFVNIDLPNLDLELLQQELQKAGYVIEIITVSDDNNTSSSNARKQQIQLNWGVNIRN